MVNLALADSTLSESGEPSTMGLLTSGGLDSAILLAQLVGHGYRVQPFYVRTGCHWQAEEIDAVHKFISALNSRLVEPLVELEMPVADLYGNHWSITGRAVPDDHTPDEAVFLPGRNPLLLLKPALWCAMHGVSKLALATLAANPFDDARPEFFERFEAMIAWATGCEVRIVRPFELLSKKCVMQLGRDVPLEFTFSCIAPVGGLHCGHCNKCAERAAAFKHLATGDPTQYSAEVA
ncbi:MAG: 7-cyano-7-deazaguanine synthase [Pirellulales bacterium]